jgi:Mn-dependent DtxR family transcriptional regulator
MNQKATTPDERFLVRLYEIASARGGPLLNAEIGAVARSLNQRETAVKNIVKHLAQANLLKKIGETVCLTERGHSLVLELLGL